MESIFANPLEELIEFGDMNRELERGQGPLLVSGCMDSQKAHLISELTKEIPWKLTFIMVFVLFLMGVSSIREFALPLMVGIVCGTYSSVCLTGSMWYLFNQKKEQKAAGERAAKTKKEK